MKQHMKWLGALVAIGLTGTLSAVETVTGGQARLARLDSNGDGHVTWEDFAARRQEQFEHVDANADGTIDFTEFAAVPRGPGPGRPQFPRRGDTWHGHLAHAAMRERMAARRDEYLAALHAELDADHDGSVSADEMQSLRQAQRRVAQKALFRHLDDNEDGSIDPEEFAGARGLRLFERLDRNGDGELTVDELPGRAAGPAGRHRHTRT